MCAQTHWSQILAPAILELKEDDPMSLVGFGLTFPIICFRLPYPVLDLPSEELVVHSTDRAG